MIQNSKYTGIIYKYTSPSGKVYIGQTARPVARRIEHLCDANHKCSTIFHKAIKKYGWENFNYEVLRTVTCNSEKELSEKLGELEQAAILLYNCLTPKGYNQAIGGSGPLGYKHTEKAKERIRLTHLGKLHTEEEKAKIAKANTGIKFTQERKDKISKAKSIPIIQLTKDGKFVKEWESAKTAAVYLNLVRSNITACCRKNPKVLSVGGFKWIYKHEYKK